MAGGCPRIYRDSGAAVFRRGCFWPVIATPWTLFVRPALVAGAAHDNVVAAPASRRAMAQVPGRRFEVDSTHTLRRFSLESAWSMNCRIPGSDIVLPKQAKEAQRLRTGSENDCTGRQSPSF